MRVVRAFASVLALVLLLRHGFLNYGLYIGTKDTGSPEIDKIDID